MELFEPILHFFEQRWVHNIIWAVILAIGTAVAAKVASKTLHHLLNRDDNPLPASSIFINIARAVIWTIGGSFILDNCFGINANALVAALGVGGIAISLGFQDTLSNLIGGMQVTFMGIIKPGDNIEVGGVSGVDEWREVYILMLTDALGLQNHQVVNRLLERIQLEILSFPDKALAVLANGSTVRVCLLEHGLIEIGIDLTFRLHLLLI